MTEGSRKEGIRLDYYNKLTDIVGTERVRRMEPMSTHTTFRIGGPADYFVMPGNENELAAVRKLARDNGVPTFLIGNGSNLLVADSGFRGIVIKLWKENEAVGMSESADNGTEYEKVRIPAGCSLARAAMQVAERGLAGFEFAAGIPGTLGGAVVMNAGAYGGEIKDCIVSARIMEEDGTIRNYSAEELKLGYRTSIIQGTDKVVLSADFRFKKDSKLLILVRIEEMNRKRREKQPLEFPSAGSTFKRPEGYFAGKLIMDAGLAGFSVGDAQISTKHCGFAINTGNATCRDMKRLIAETTARVEEQFGVRLEPEIRFLGSDED